MYIYENRWGAYIKGTDNFFSDYDRAEEYCKANNINTEDITENIEFRIEHRYNHRQIIDKCTIWGNEYSEDYDSYSETTSNEIKALDALDNGDYVYIIIDNEEYAEIEKYSDGTYSI